MGLSTSTYIGPVITCTLKKSDKLYTDVLREAGIDVDLFSVITEYGFNPTNLEKEILILNQHPRDYLGIKHFHNIPYSLNIKMLPDPIVAINQFREDFQKEITILESLFERVNVNYLLISWES